jgi:hypothetical protein
MFFSKIQRLTTYRISMHKFGKNFYEVLRVDCNATPMMSSQIASAKSKKKHQYSCFVKFEISSLDFRTVKNVASAG